MFRVVVSYRNSTSNHNSEFVIKSATPLYLIEILHQTTTGYFSSMADGCCILSKFYIKPQRESRESEGADSCILSKFYIKPQLPMRVFLAVVCCILSKFYIKPQPWQHLRNHPLVVSYRNSTSNHNLRIIARSLVFVVSYRNSTSNHNVAVCRKYCQIVVSYRNSTSNHNFVGAICITSGVVSYRNSTSNHNGAPISVILPVLYLIEILHQTTTLRFPLDLFASLYLIEILHQTTT